VRTRRKLKFGAVTLDRCQRSGALLPLPHFAVPPHAQLAWGLFFSCPGRSAARVLLAGVHSTLHGVVFAIFCPGPAVPGPGHEIVSASGLRDESIQLKHIVL
jgi:hypothetical protein